MENNNSEILKLPDITNGIGKNEELSRKVFSLTEISGKNEEKTENNLERGKQLEKEIGALRDKLQKTFEIQEKLNKNREFLLNLSKNRSKQNPFLLENDRLHELDGKLALAKNRAVSSEEISNLLNDLLDGKVKIGEYAD